MANSSPRLSTAELRRRLQAPAGVPAPIAPEPPPPPPRAAAQRFSLPANLAHLPDSPIEDDATVAFADLADRPVASRVPTPPPQPRPAVRSGSSPRVGRPTLPDVYAEAAPVEPDDSVRQENEQLQVLLEEMRQLLQEASEQEARTQTALTERDGQLAEALGQLKPLKEELAHRPKTRGELEEWSDELEQESAKVSQQVREMEADRRQLREDESALEKQMRDMEVQMARERAMLARQEQELRRLNAEIQHQLEGMERGDGVLRDRLAVFQRRHAEVVNGGTPMAEAVGGPRSYFGQAPVAQAATVTPPPKKNDTTGLLRKIFRSE